MLLTFKGFTTGFLERIYGHSNYLGHITQTLQINFVPPTQRESTRNMASTGLNI